MNKKSFQKSRVLSSKNQKGFYRQHKTKIRTFIFATALFCYTGCKKNDPGDSPSNLSTGKGVSIVSSNNLWYDKFTTYESSAGGAYYQSTNAATLGWSESYMLRSYMTLYEVTKNTNWLDKLVTHADEIIGNATDLGSDGYLDWGTTGYSSNGANYPYLVFDGLISYPIAKFVRLVYQTPSLQTAYMTKATSYKDFIEDEIAPKWSTSASWMGNCWNTAGYYREPATFDSLPDAVFNPLPYNMMAPFALMLYTMYDVNGSTNYKTKADAMAQYLRAALSGNPTSGYTWNYCNIPNPHLEDTSHGNLDVELLTEAFNRGVTGFSGSYMQGLSNTFTDNMWNQSLTAPLVKKYVDGSGDNSHTKLLTGWITLAQFNAKCWKIAAEQFRSTSISSFNHAHTMAQIVSWDPVKVHNQGFEYKSFSDVTLPARWTRIGSPSSAITRHTADKYSGAASIKITSTSSDGVWQGAYQDWTEFTPGASYTVTFNVKTSGTAGARIFMYNTSTSSVIRWPESWK